MKTIKLQVTLLFAAASLAGCAYNAPSVFQQTAADDTPEHVKTVLLNAAQEMAWSVCEKAPNHYDLSRKHKIWSIHGDLVLDGTSWTLRVDPEFTTLSSDDGTKVHSEANKQIKSTFLKAGGDENLRTGRMRSRSTSPGARHVRLACHLRRLQGLRLHLHQQVLRRASPPARTAHPGSFHHLRTLPSPPAG